MKLGRNDLCYCGSGKKNKKCCLLKGGIYIPENLAIFDNFDQINYINKPEPFLNIVPSVIWNGSRHRAIWNKIYHRPIEETFHEFLHCILLWTFGKAWHAEQISLPHENRHIVGKWLFSLAEWQKSHMTDSNKDRYCGNEKWGAIVSGEVQALMQISYDIYCLQNVNKLPEFLVNRLRSLEQFQGARYEIAVAAMIARAGFEITFLDDNVKQEKHCEFIAKHKISQIEFGIEAKSRHRKGVLNQGGNISDNGELRGDVWRLFNKARLQKPKDIPFLIFIDMNLPPTPDVPFEEKIWMKDIIKMVNDYGPATIDNPDPYNATIFTNYAYFYTGNSEQTPSGEYSVCISKCPETPFSDNKTINDVIESVHKYGLIPEEV
jgi:uncharacterized protein YchJ